MRTLCVRGKGETWQLYQTEIKYIRQIGKMLEICTDREMISCPGSIAALQDQLGEEFFPCHKYCLANFSRILVMRNGEITFDTGDVLTMGINYYRRTRRAFHGYLDHREHMHQPFSQTARVAETTVPRDAARRRDDTGGAMTGGAKAGGAGNDGAGTDGVEDGKKKPK
ncbi:MAG: LytTR family transcriptional regulator DNA-binding domain-containing protein [Anaerovoracaceae bacterium]|jgi:hypothetical protein